MSLVINVCSFSLGFFSGISVYKKQEVDYKLLGMFYFCVSPYQLVTAYTNIDIVHKINLNRMRPSIVVLLGLSTVCAVNGSIFGTGYVLGNSYAKTRDSSRLE